MSNPGEFESKLREAEKTLSRKDPAIRALVRKYGACRISPHTRYFDTLIGSIISQQLSTKAADTIHRRFLDLMKPSRRPRPELVLQLPDEAIRSAGISSQKLGYIKDLAAKTHSGEVKLSRISRMTDEEIIESLTSIKGIGVWTVHMFLIFSLGRLNVLPVGDLGIRNAIQRILGLEEPPKPNEIYQIAEERKWAPHCSVASWYLWRSLENKPE